jgi:hypothetical protein
MKLTKDRFSTWECKDDKDYEQELDDELIINVKEGESSRDIADSILFNQNKLDRLYKLDLSKVIRFTGTVNGDQHEEHNDIVNMLVKILGDNE